MVEVRGSNPTVSFGIAQDVVSTRAACLVVMAWGCLSVQVLARVTGPRIAQRVLVEVIRG
jgi:hypothetical protein